MLAQPIKNDGTIIATKAENSEIIYKLNTTSRPKQPRQIVRTLKNSTQQLGCPQAELRVASPPIRTHALDQENRKSCQNQ